MKLERELQNAITSGSRDGVDKCFNKIFNQYYKLCVFVASQYVSSFDETEDIVQDVFINFFNNVLDTKALSINNIKQYLCTSSRNKAINTQKHHSKENSVPFDENIISSLDLPIDVVTNELQQSWNNLSKLEKEIIIDHLFLDKTFDEISKEVGESANTLKSRYRRTLIKMRKELRK